MADYLTTDTDLTAVADAIRAKGGTSAALEYPDGFVSAIGAISTGITPTGTISITENGTYDVTDYASAEVNVSGGSSVSLTYAGFYGVANGKIYYTDENMQQQSGTSLAANLPSGSIVAVVTTETSTGITFEPNPYDPMSTSFGLTSLKTLTVSRKTYAQVFKVN